MDATDWGLHFSKLQKILTPEVCFLNFIVDVHQLTVSPAFRLLSSNTLPSCPFLLVSVRFQRSAGSHKEGGKVRGEERQDQAGGRQSRRQGWAEVAELQRTLDSEVVAVPF